MKNVFYVYCLFRPWDLSPFLIGKGKGARAEFHAKAGTKHYNLRVANIFRKAEQLGLEVPCVILHNSLDEATAFEYERAFIAAIGRTDLGNGSLCNCTDGGEGSSGWIPSEETIANISAAQIQRFKDHPELKTAISATQRGRVQSEEEKTKRGISSVAVWQRPGYKEAWVVAAASVRKEAGRKNSIAHKKLWATSEYREKVKNRKPRPRSAETNKKIGDSQRGKPCPQRGRKRST